MSTAPTSLSSLEQVIPAEGVVLVVTNDFPPQHGGIQTYVARLCADLTPERVVVYAPSHPEAVEHDATLPYTVVRDARRTLLPGPRLTAQVQQVMADVGAEHVVFGAAMPLGLMASGLRAAGARSVTAMTHGHEVWWATLPGTRAALKRVGAQVDVLTYVSEYTGRRIGRALAPPDRAKMIRLVPPVDPAFNPGVSGARVRARLGIPSDAPVVVCVARLVRRKGQDRLVRIWPKVLQELPDAHLILVGDGPDLGRLLRMVRRRDLASAVHVVGEVDQTPEYYAAGTVFAMPVRNRFFGLEVEGLGLSYLEAAACGLHVVPGRHGGAPEAWRGEHTAGGGVRRDDGLRRT